MRLPVTDHSLRSKGASSSELVNCYLEVLPQDAKAPYVIRRCPGMVTHFGIDSAGSTNNQIYYPIRGMVEYGNAFREPHVLAVSVEGTQGRVYAVTEDGAIGGSSGAYTFTASSEDIDLDKYTDGGVVMTTGDLAYTLTNSADTQISDADFTARGAADVEFLDNYLLFREPGTGRFFGSDVGSVTAYTSTSFATAEGLPDVMVGMKSDGSNLYLFGQESIEIWDAVGGSGFPFRKVINGVIRKGCGAGRTIVLVENMLYWVAEDFTVRRLNGMVPERISNHGVEQKISDFGLSGLKGFWYQWEGHNFYAIRSPNYTFVFDTITGQWHQRKSLGFDSWNYACSCQAFKQKRWFFGSERVVYEDDPLVGGEQFGYPVSYQDKDTFTDNGEAQVMSWTYQPVYKNGQRVFHDRLELVMETGLGTEDTSSDGYAPKIQMEYSDDDGKTWQYGAERDIGSYGQGYQRVVWHQLGASYKRIYRLSTSDAFAAAVVDTHLDTRLGKR